MSSSDGHTPVGAPVDTDLLKRVESLCAQLPQNFAKLTQTLFDIQHEARFDPARVRAYQLVVRQLDDLLDAGFPAKRGLLTFARKVLSPAEAAFIARRLVRDHHRDIRRSAVSLLHTKRPLDVALPATPDGDWDYTGYLRGIEKGRLDRHKGGVRRQQEQGVPTLQTVGELRELLGIASPEQLGFLLVASDNRDNNPYVRFTIPKRDGSPREICAPGRVLRRVQRAILDNILASLPTHDAAHGFVPGRSTVTNAEPHVGKQLLIKFDLKDFFPTLGYWRIVGLFAHLGYYLDERAFSTRDDSRAVAPTLARLCVYTDEPKRFGSGYTPQGAPTSPALSNLVCRNLDARLTGLAQKLSGTYTRYADDLTFSFNTAPPGGIGRFRWWVDQICQQEGFIVRHDKFRVIRASQRQQVTGIVVNDTLRVPRNERRRFRAILHNCKKHGVASQARGRKDFDDYLRGYASYIHMVHPEEGARLRAEVDRLLEENP